LSGEAVLSAESTGTLLVSVKFLGGGGLFPIPKPSPTLGLRSRFSVFRTLRLLR